MVRMRVAVCREAENRMKLRIFLVTCLLAAGMVACSTPDETSPSGGKQVTADEPRHVKVYFEKGMFGGWPANHGIWSWGNEILVGFGMGYYKDQGLGHHIDREKPEIPMLARSLDGGETWSIEDPGAKGYLLTEGGYLHGVTRPGVTIPALKESEGGIDFTHPDLALTVRTNSIHAGIGRIFYSYDRGHTWDGPFRLPSFDSPGIAPRTDYIIDDNHTCTLFITAAKANGREGRPLCVRTTDSGKTWKFVSWIGSGARRVLHHAGLGPAFRNGHSCHRTHARCDQEVDQDLPVNRQRRQLGIPERGGA